MTPGLTLLAATNSGQLRIYEKAETTLPTSQTIDLTTYENLRSENIKAHIGKGNKREVIFSQCTTAADPCPQTRIRHMIKNEGDTAWELKTGTFSTGAVESCDMFAGFDAQATDTDAPAPDTDLKALMTYQSACPSGEPIISARKENGLGQSFFGATPVSATVPEVDAADELVPHVAANGATLDVLLAASDRLEIMHAEQDTLTWVGTLETGLTPGLLPMTHYRFPSLSRTGNGLRVVFAFGGTTYIWRANE
jgi:hypothetical protein